MRQIERGKNAGIYDPTEAKDIRHDITKEARQDIWTDVLNNFWGDAGVLLLDFAASGATSVFIPATLFRAAHWELWKPKDPDLTYSENSRRVTKNLLNKYFLNYFKKNEQPQKTREEYLLDMGRRAAKKKVLAGAAVAIGAGIGVARSVAAYLNPEFGRRGPVVDFMQNIVLPHFSRDLQSAYAHSDKAIVNTVLITGTIAATQLSNALLQHAKERNFTNRYVGMIHRQRMIGR